MRAPRFLPRDARREQLGPVMSVGLRRRSVVAREKFWQGRLASRPLDAPAVRLYSYCHCEEEPAKQVTTKQSPSARGSLDATPWRPYDSQPVPMLLCGRAGCHENGTAGELGIYEWKKIPRSPTNIM
jgi:hypothetical protein